MDGIKTRATDFHSLRRGLVSAMRRAQIPTRLAMAIVHHTIKATHDSYDTLERDVTQGEGELFEKTRRSSRRSAPESAVESMLSI